MSVIRSVSVGIVNGAAIVAAVAYFVHVPGSFGPIWATGTLLAVCVNLFGHIFEEDKP